MVYTIGSSRCLVEHACNNCRSGDWIFLDTDTMKHSRAVDKTGDRLTHRQFVALHQTSRVLSNPVSYVLCMVCLVTLYANITNMWFCMHTDHTYYDNFIVGLRNISPRDSTPILWDYDVCGQYSGRAPHAQTVSVYCRDNLTPYRYVIVQIPKLYSSLVACEIEVHVRGMRMSNINILIFTIQGDNSSMLLLSVPLL